MFRAWGHQFLVTRFSPKIRCDVLRQDEEQEEEEDDEEEDEEEGEALIVMRLSLTSLLLPVILFIDSEL